MAFANPIAGGQGALIREQLRSPNYVAGISGWNIAKDGSAEFNDIVARGEIWVTDPDGSYIRIYDENPGSGALVAIKPADVPGHTITPGGISTDAGVGFAELRINTPGYDGTPSVSGIALGMGTGATYAQLNGTEVYLNAFGSQLALNNLGNGLSTCNNGIIGAGYAGESNPATTSPNTDSKATAGMVDMAGTGSITSFSFAKNFDPTEVKLNITGSFFANNASSSLRFAMRIDGVDYICGRVSQTLAANVHTTFSGWAYVPAGALAAGSYNVQARWENVSGVGSLFRNFEDWLCIEATECLRQ